MIVLCVIFTIFNFAFPQHMATFSEGIGNYNLAVKYASLRYSYTHEIDDLARCFDDAVLWKNDKYIIQYGEELIKSDGFDELCASKSQSGSSYAYRQRVLGKISISYYNTGKKGKAVELAASANGYTGFAYGNALMSLASVVKAANDSEVCGLLIKKLDEINPVSQDELSTLNEVKSSLRAIVAAYGS